jgi:quercetin dioxygenase-like cupin family protein
MPASPQDQTPIVRKPLLTAQLVGAKLCARVEVKEITFAPGQRTGLHLHPIPVVGYIAKGEFLFQVEGEEARTLKAGDAFFEPAETRIVHFDNASAQAPGTFIAFYLMDAKDSELITMLE